MSRLSLLWCCAPFLLVAACSSASSDAGAGDGDDDDDAADAPDAAGGSSGNPASSSGGPAQDDAPHALGTVVLGETHAAGQGSATPIVSAAFVPSASAMPKVCSTQLEGCAIFTAPRCKDTDSFTGCDDGEACTWSDSCAPVCTRVPVCDDPCDEDEVCTTSGSHSACTKIESFDAGPLAFGGTTTPLTMYPPYRYSGDGEGAPFLAGTDVRVQAAGASGAGFAAFDETFRSTTFLQTTPALDKITREKAFARTPLTVGWTAGADDVRVTVAGPLNRAECTASDAAGTFDVPRAVLDRVLTNAEGKREDGSLAITVARERTEVRKGKATKGSLQSTRIESEGWLSLVTTSAESTQIQGCGSGVACGDDCVDLDVDADHCGTCTTKCTGTETCQSGTCKGETTTPHENTLALCSDGISNDADAYIDCDDYDCCGVRTCPSGTACTP